jgi:hypothetical protein
MTKPNKNTIEKHRLIGTFINFLHIDTIFKDLCGKDTPPRHELLKKIGIVDFDRNQCLVAKRQDGRYTVRLKCWLKHDYPAAEQTNAFIVPRLYSIIRNYAREDVRDQLLSVDIELLPTEPTTEVVIVPKDAPGLKKPKPKRNARGIKGPGQE